MANEGTHAGGSSVAIVAILAIAVLVVLFVVYGLPGLQSASQPTQVDVSIPTPGATDSGE